MTTFFAPAERADPLTLDMEIAAVDNSQVLAALLTTISGLVAVVNEQRQVVALNTTFLTFLGIDDPHKVLGMRPGEIVNCIHSGKEPAGCGTTRYCVTCGAAIAMMSSLASNEPSERICSLSVNLRGGTTDLVLQVKVRPINLEGRRFLLLFLQDITLQEQRSALERTFFHDVCNTVNMLIGASDILIEESPGELSSTINRISMRLVNEITLQRCLSNDQTTEYSPVFESHTVGEINDDLQSALKNHPVKQNKVLLFDHSVDETVVVTDRSLFLRIVSNMVINALEASEAYATVRVWVTTEEKMVTWHVWNSGSIPPEIALRVFQRYFSTKAQSGRGIGTYSMKLFGEKYLGGAVDFSSTAEQGTEFWVAVPVECRK